MIPSNSQPSVPSVCSVDYSVATLEILKEIFNKEWPGPEMLWIHGAHGGHGWLMSRER